MAAKGGRKCMDFLLCGYAAGRLGNGLPKRFSTVFGKNWYQSRYRCCFRRSSTGTGSEKMPVEQYRVYAALREAPK